MCFYTYSDDEPFEDRTETAFHIEMDVLRQIEELIDRCKIAGVLHEVGLIFLKFLNILYD